MLGKPWILVPMLTIYTNQPTSKQRPSDSHFSGCSYRASVDFSQCHVPWDAASKLLQCSSCIVLLGDQCEGAKLSLCSRMLMTPLNRNVTRNRLPLFPVIPLKTVLEMCCHRAFFSGGMLKDLHVPTAFSLNHKTFETLWIESPGPKKKKKAGH